MSEAVVARLDPAQADVHALIAAADAFYAGLYPPESNHLESVDDLTAPGVLFVGCRVDGELAACGAARRRHDDGCYAEIKRVFVLPKFRGRGLSRAIMRHLEAELERDGVRLLRLETGVHQPAALGLYRNLGYRERGPFGSYRPDPLSVFMEKRLAGETLQD